MAKVSWKWLVPVMRFWDYVYHNILGAPVASAEKPEAEDAPTEGRAD